MPDRARTPTETARSRKLLRYLPQWVRFRGLTQAEFANKMGTSEATVSKWLSRKQGMSVEQFLRAAEILDAKPTEILGDAAARDRSARYQRLAEAFQHMGDEQFDAAIDGVLALLGSRRAD